MRTSRPVSLRVDSGFYTVELLEACRRQRVEFCVSYAPWLHDLAGSA